MTLFTYTVTIFCAFVDLLMKEVKLADLAPVVQNQSIVGLIRLLRG